MGLASILLVSASGHLAFVTSRQLGVMGTVSTWGAGGGGAFPRRSSTFRAPADLNRMGNCASVAKSSYFS